MKKIVFSVVTLVLVVAFILSACAAPKTPSPTPSPEKPGAAAPAPTAPGAALTREQKLIEAAKKEGEVVLWTISWSPGPVERAFEAKYPFIRLKAWDGSEGVKAKLQEEYKAGLYTPDVIQLSQRDLVRFREMGILGEYEFPNVVGWKRQPDHNFWKNHQVSLRVPAYNTKMVSPADVPRKWEDLNDTKWRGKAIMSLSGADYPLLHAYLLGDVTKEGIKLERSVKFWKDVVQTTRPVIGSGFKGPMEQLVVGDVSIMLMSSATTTLDLIRKGAPVDFAPINKVVGGVWGLALTSKPPHPNAARLLLDFLTSEEGALVHADSSPNPTLHPTAAKKAYANQYFASRGVEWTDLPMELAADEEYNRAADLWLKDILGVKR
ncbi:MAG: putative transporter substrate-binding protein [Dehalococcoidia bacterium]|nr:putative transporter substrate-binding protein [Dehalococcoidia bacterium]